MRAARLVLAAAGALLCVTGASDASDASAAGRPDRDAFASSGARVSLPRSVRAAQRRAARPGSDIQMERRLGLPTALWAADPGTGGGAPASAARRHLRALAPAYGLTAGDVASATVDDVQDTGRGPVVVTFRQSVDGVPVYREKASVVMTADRRLVGVGGYLAPVGDARTVFALSAREAVARAASDLLGRPVAPGDLRPRGARAGGYELFAAAAIADPARVRRVMYRLPAGLVPAYDVEVGTPDGARLTDDVIGAADGAVLSRRSLVERAAYSYRVWADAAAPNLPLDGPQGNAASPNPTGSPDGFAPPFAAPSLVTLASGPIGTGDPWLPPAATETTGNNADAYADLDPPTGFTPSTADMRAATTAAGVFDHVYDTSAEPTADAGQTQAAITQAFYDVNWLHDWFYDSGFDEGAGNAQDDDYGRGGLAGDGIDVEVQDFSARNNSNMSTPADGARPVMQLFPFDGPAPRSLTVNAPAGIAGDYVVGAMDFGPTVFTTTAAVALANDGVGPTTDACQVPGAGVAGKIALIDRGGCTIKAKVKNAQDAGAVGVVLANNVPGAPPTFADDPAITATITTPALVVAQDVGASLKTALGSGTVNVTLRSSAAVDHEAGIDNELVAHEWAHYMSERLVGSLAGTQAGGLNEGWSDFVALLMIVRAEDGATGFAGAYPFAPYASQGLSDSSYYHGIRRLPYSTDAGRNGLTFRHIADGEPLPAGALDLGANSEVHNAGEVWASMLWEAYAALLRDTLGPQPRLTFAQAQTRMRTYLVAAQKATPPDPTLLEARDALLMVAGAGDPADGLRFWEAFAKRGAGTRAVGPDRGSATNSPVVESYDVDGSMKVTAMSLSDDQRSCDAGDGFLDNGERGRLLISVRNDGARALQATTATVTSANPHVGVETATVAVPATQPFQTAQATAIVTLDGATGLEDLDLSVALHDPGLPASAPATGRLVVRGGARVAAAVSASDDVESPVSSWTPRSDAGGADWARATAAGPLNAVWHGPDAAHRSDGSLVSPVLKVGSAPLVLRFRHRFSFETGYDGGVVEISDDAGATWTDASAVAGATGYTDLLQTGSGNVLGGRPAYSGQSSGYPGYATQTIGLGTAYAGKQILVRFRVGSDDAAGGAGWDVDDIVVSGLTNTPFNRLAVDPGCPKPGAPATGASTGSRNRAPVVRSVSLSPSRFRAARSGAAIVAAARVGARVRFALSEAATIRVRVQFRATGRRVGSRCVRPTRRSRSRRPCALWPSRPGAERLGGRPGPNAFRFSGRWRGRALRPGVYRLALTATDPQGASATATTREFRIVR